MRCGITVMQMKLSLWGISGLSETCLPEQVSIVHSRSVPGAYQVIHSPKVNINAAVNRTIQAAAAAHCCPHPQLIHFWSFLIEKKGQKSLDQILYTCVVTQFRIHISVNMWSFYP